MDIGELVKFTRNLRVLYVEDNLEARESTVSMLENFFDDIIIAVDGQDGLDKFRNSEKIFDLIISDINMPKMNGLDMIKEIRNIDNSVYVVILSAHKESGYMKDIESVGANDIILKPIEIDRFMELLISLCEKYKD